MCAHLPVGLISAMLLRVSALAHFVARGSRELSKQSGKMMVERFRP